MGKDPAKQKAGRAGMRARWGPPRIARLDQLDPRIREAVLALIRADQAANMKTTPDSVSAGVVTEEGRSHASQPSSE